MTLVLVKKKDKAAILRIRRSLGGWVIGTLISEAPDISLLITISIHKLSPIRKGRYVHQRTILKRKRHPVNILSYTKLLMKLLINVETENWDIYGSGHPIREQEFIKNFGNV